MSDKSLLIIGSQLLRLDDPLLQPVLALWTGPGSPQPSLATVAQVLAGPEILSQARVCWLVMDQHTSSEYYEVVTLLQDRQLPALLTRPQETQPAGAPVQSGVLAAPAQAPAETRCALLRSLFSHAAALYDLQVETKVLRIHQHGLIDQIDRIDEELRLAAQLQREFLPTQLPKIAGLDCHVFFRPATYVSGDIYDLIRLDETHVGFFLADAVGHGVPAALLTVFIKQALWTKEINRAFRHNYRIVPPEETLARLNSDMIALQTGKVRTATAWYGVLNCATYELQYARAGHPLPLLLHADGSSQFLDAEGALLGVFPEEAFTPTTVQLQPGDRLLIYSDGFETAFQQAVGKGGQSPGLANNQYHDEFKSLAHGPIDAALDRFIKRLDQQTGSLNQIDDLTVLCLGVHKNVFAAPPAKAALVQV